MRFSSSETHRRRNRRNRRFKDAEHGSFDATTLRIDGGWREHSDFLRRSIIIHFVGSVERCWTNSLWKRSASGQLTSCLPSTCWSTEAIGALLRMARRVLGCLVQARRQLHRRRGVLGPGSQLGAKVARVGLQAIPRGSMEVDSL